MKVSMGCNEEQMKGNLGDHLESMSMIALLSCSMFRIS
jgi:hypothetical protein